MMMGRVSQRRSSVGGARELLTLMMTMMMMMMMMMMVEEVSAEDVETEDSDEILDEDEIPASSDMSRVSPLSSWLIFRRNSHRGDNSRRSRGSRRTSKVRDATSTQTQGDRRGHMITAGTSVHLSQSLQHGLPGPPGPPGPQGPPGPPTPLLPQQQELVQELQLKLRDLAGVCVPCDRPRVSASFLSRLLQPINIPRRSLVELRPFIQPADSGRSLQRGQSFNSSSGRFTAAVSGFYQLTTSLMIESGDRQQVRLKDSVRAAICIESLCQNNLSVESVVGVAAVGGTFSILLSGTLYLQTEEYVSVFVDNASGSSISVLPESLFSGILLGV